MCKIKTREATRSKSSPSVQFSVTLSDSPSVQFSVTLTDSTSVQFSVTLSDSPSVQFSVTLSDSPSVQFSVTLTDSPSVQFSVTLSDSPSVQFSLPSLILLSFSQFSLILPFYSFFLMHPFSKTFFRTLCFGFVIDFINFYFLWNAFVFVSRFRKQFDLWLKKGFLINLLCLVSELFIFNVKRFLLAILICKIIIFFKCSSLTKYQVFQIFQIVQKI